MIDFEKYNPLKDTKATAPRLTNWKDSALVMSLSEYLKQHTNQGIKLYQSEDGKACLCFSPGLGTDDMKTERWRIANEAERLLLAAADDLNQLLANGMIVLPNK